MLYQLSYGRTAATKLGRHGQRVKQTPRVPWGLAVINGGWNTLPTESAMLALIDSEVDH